MKCRETPTEGKSCETLVGFSMYGSPMETVEHMWVYIWYMLDWTVGFCRKTAEMHFLSIHLIN